MTIPLRLAIVVGHTRLSPGAHCPLLNEYEYGFNKRLALMMQGYADERPEDVVMRVFFRDGVGVAGAYAQAADWGCHASLELHFNSSANPVANGTETLFAPHSSRGRALAESVQQHMVAALGLRDRGAHEPWQGRGMASLTALSVPAIITEAFFGSNNDDALKASRLQRALGEAIVQGAVEWWAQDRREGV